jgi:hypothetical protein
MPKTPFDEDGLGNYDVGIIFLLSGKDHMQMTLAFYKNEIGRGPITIRDCNLVL